MSLLFMVGHHKSIFRAYVAILHDLPKFFDLAYIASTMANRLPLSNKWQRPYKSKLVSLNQTQGFGPEVFQLAVP